FHHPRRVPHQPDPDPLHRRTRRIHPPQTLLHRLGAHRPHRRHRHHLIPHPRGGHHDQTPQREGRRHPLPPRPPGGRPPHHAHPQLRRRPKRHRQPPHRRLHRRLHRPTRPR